MDRTIRRRFHLGNEDLVVETDSTCKRTRSSAANDTIIGLPCQNGKLVRTASARR
jgi:hypothetical protein